MPAPTVAARRAAAIAKHHPEILYERNRGLLKMKKEDLEEYASTPEKNLPKKAQNRKAVMKKMRSMKLKDFEQYANEKPKKGYRT